MHAQLLAKRIFPFIANPRLDTSDFVFWRINCAESGTGPFAMRFRDDPIFNSQRNSVIYLGYNPALMRSGEPSLYASFEANYYDGTHHWMEFHVEGQFADLTDHRAISAQINRDTKAVVIYLNGTAVVLRNSATTNTVLQTSGDNLHIGDTTLFRKLVNNAVFMTQLDAAASTYLNLPFINAADELEIQTAARSKKQINFDAGTTARPQMNLAASTAPTSPANGDIWADAVDLYMRLGSVTRKLTSVVSTGGRLALATATPIHSSDQTAKQTVYFTPWAPDGNGDRVLLYDASGNPHVVEFTEKTIKVQDAQTGTRNSTGNAIISGLTDTSQLIVGMEITGTGVGASSVISTIDSATQVTGTVNNTATGTATVTFKVPASKVLDIFAIPSGQSVVLRMVQWTNDTTRATALALNRGAYTKTGDSTWLYLGTVRTTTTAGETESSITKRFLWNFFNQVDIPVYKEDSTSHTYSTAAWREWNGATDTHILQAIYPLSGLQQLIDFSVEYSGGPLYAGVAEGSVGSTIIQIANNSSGTVTYARSINRHPTLGYRKYIVQEYGNTTNGYSSYALAMSYRG